MGGLHSLHGNGFIRIIYFLASFGNHGCQGGLMDYAFRYLETEKDETEKDYPYLAEVN